MTDNITDFGPGIFSVEVSPRPGSESTVTDLNINLKNIGLGTAKNIRCLCAEMKEASDLPFTSCLPGDQKTILVDFYFTHPEDMTSYEATVLFQMRYEDLLENHYQQDLSLTFFVSGPDQIERVKHTIGVPALVEMNQ